MNTRSKKYYESRKAQSGNTKGSATNAGYDEQNEKTIKEPKKNPASSKTKEQPKVAAKATQDDTDGGNDSGKKK
ncbi:MAG TPA: hypothetical protein VIM07_10765 [Chitinophagaceae bacterium]|jgi:hypothetical protein